MNKTQQQELQTMLKRNHLDRKFRSYVNKKYPCNGNAFEHYIQCVECELAVQKIALQVEEDDKAAFKDFSKLWINTIILKSYSYKLGSYVQEYGAPRMIAAMSQAIDTDIFEVPIILNMGKDKNAQLNVIDDIVTDLILSGVIPVVEEEEPVLVETSTHQEEVQEEIVEDSQEESNSSDTIPADNARAWVDIVQETIETKSKAMLDMVASTSAEIAEAMDELSKYINQDTQSDAWQDKVEKLTERCQVISNENDILHNKIGDLNDQIANLDYELDKAREYTAEVVKDKNAAIKTIASLREKIAELDYLNKTLSEKKEEAPKVIVKTAVTVPTRIFDSYSGIGPKTINTINKALSEFGYEIIFK